MDLARLLATVPFAHRDAVVDELLGIEPPPPDVALPPGAVPYLPCGVAELEALVRDAPVTAADRVVVLGAGLGRAAFVVHLLSGARVHGIEIQGHLVARARATVGRLGLTGVTFEHADFTEAELDAEIVFLYAPCNGAMLDKLLDRVRTLAARRAIAIGAVGLELERPWLRSRSSAGALALYDSVRADVSE